VADEGAEEEQDGDAAKEGTGKDPLGDPKSALAHQLDLIKRGDVKQLKTCFTERLRGRITPALVEDAKKEISDYAFEDLWHDSAPGEDEGKKTVKVKMENGRTLTTFVETEGRWLADTLWFR